MKKTLITVFITALATAVIVLAIFEIVNQLNQVDADVVETISSKVLKEDRKVLVHLPRNYDPEDQYPIMYVLDGSSQDFRMASILQILNAAKVAPEVIIVGIPNVDRNRDLTPHYILTETGGEVFGKGDDFLTFIQTEVVPLIEKKYPTNGYRMLVGHSRAGLYSYYAYLERPGFFDAHICFSPAYWRDNSQILTEVKSFYKNEPTDDTFLFMSLGENENPKMTKGYWEVVNHLESLPYDIKLVHSITPMAGHGDNSYFSAPLALSTWSDYYQEKK